MRHTMSSIASLSFLGILAATALGQVPDFITSTNVAHGMVGNEFVVYGQIANGGDTSGLLVFTVQPNVGGDKNNSPQSSNLVRTHSASDPSDPSSTWPLLPVGSRRQAGVVVANQLMVLGTNNRLSILNNPNASQVTWSTLTSSTSDFRFTSGAQLLRIDDNSLLALSNSPLSSHFQISLTGPSLFINRPIPPLDTRLEDPQFGYDTSVNHLVAVGGNGSGKLGVVFFDSNFNLAVRHLKDDEAPSQRRDFCFTWDDSSNSFYLFGGVSGATLLGDAYSLRWNANDERWVWSALHVPPNVPPRANAACAVHNNQLILWGGDGNTAGVDALAVTLSSDPFRSGPGAGDPQVAPSSGKVSSSSPPLGAIIGGSVGGLVLVLILLGLVLFCRRKQRRTHHRGLAGDDEDEIVEAKSRSMASQGVVPLVPSPFTSDDDALDPYGQSTQSRTPTGSSSFTAGSTLYSPAYTTSQPLMDHAIMPATSTPDYMKPPLQPIMTSQPFHYHQQAYTPSSAHSSPTSNYQSHSQPLPVPTETEVQSRAISLTNNNNSSSSSGLVSPHQRFDPPHGAPYGMENRPVSLPPPPSPPNRPPYSGSPMTHANRASLPPLGSAPNTAGSGGGRPSGLPSQEPEWDVLIPVTDEDDMSTQAALGMVSTVGGLSASHREFKHELPDSDVEEEEEQGATTVATKAAGKDAQDKQRGAPARKASVSSLASHAETESGIGFLELWVPPNDEPPVPPVPHIPQHQ